MPFIDTALTLKDLPAPPSDKSGWPWTEQSQLLPERIPEKAKRSRISIVTPSYNQGEFIEETIRSVLLQNYSNLEYIIIDGGSTDNSVEIIEKYANYLTYWISEPDQGQTHAVNKGLAKSTGDVWSYLNSDDLLCPEALNRVAELFENPDIFWVAGVSDVFDRKGHRGFISPNEPLLKKEYLTPWNREFQYVFPCSNASFMRRRILEQCGFFEETYNYSMDIEYYTRAVFKGGFCPHITPHILARWRWHLESKTMQEGIAYGFRSEEIRIATHYLQNIDPKEKQQVRRELQVQNKWLPVRRALFYKKQAKRERALQDLIASVKNNPSLLLFRPWVSALVRVIIN